MGSESMIPYFSFSSEEAPVGLSFTPFAFLAGDSSRFSSATATTASSTQEMSSETHSAEITT